MRSSVGRYDPWGIKATGFAVTRKIRHYTAVTFRVIRQLFLLILCIFFPAGHAILTIGAVFVRLWHRHKLLSGPEGPSKWHGVGTLSALSVVFSRFATNVNAEDKGRTQAALHAMGRGKRSAFPCMPSTILGFKKEKSTAISLCASVQGFRGKGTIVFLLQR